jgi:hypothetical protein
VIWVSSDISTGEWGAGGESINKAAAQSICTSHAQGEMSDAGFFPSARAHRQAEKLLFARQIHLHLRTHHKKPSRRPLFRLTSLTRLVRNVRHDHHHLTTQSPIRRAFGIAKVKWSDAWVPVTIDGYGSQADADAGPDPRADLTGSPA